MKKWMLLLLPLLLLRILPPCPASAEGLPSFPAPPSVSAQCAVVMEQATGKILYAKNEQEPRPIASTTKIMTALLALEQADLLTPFEVDAGAIMVEGTSMGLQPGDIVTLEILAQGMLLPSGNDAANAAAVHIAGSIPAFAARMNGRAREIGMDGTHFVSPSGLDAEGHHSTALDMARLARRALQNPDFARICSSKSAKVQFLNQTYPRTLQNHNRLLSSYEGCIGVKTGFTKKAGRCLVSAAQRDGAQLICVTLNAPNDWQDHESLLDYGFSLQQTQLPDDNFFGLLVPVTGGETSSIGVRCRERPSYVSATGEDVTREIRLPRFLYAPVTEGDVVGKAVYWYEGETLFETELLATHDVQARERQPTAWEQFLSWIGLS